MLKKSYKSKKFFMKIWWLNCKQVKKILLLKGGNSRILIHLMFLLIELDNLIIKCIYNIYHLSFFFCDAFFWGLVDASAFIGSINFLGGTLFAEIFEDFLESLLLYSYLSDSNISSTRQNTAFPRSVISIE